MRTVFKIKIKKKRCSNHVFLLEQSKNYQDGRNPHANTAAWSCDLERHPQNALRDIANWRKRRPSSYTTFLVLAWMITISRRKNLKQLKMFSEVCSRIALTFLYLARIGRPDIQWSVNKLARSVTTWTQACDRRLSRLISYIHHASDYRQYCHVVHTSQHYRLALFQDSDFAGDLEDSKSSSGGFRCIFRSRTFVPIIWTRKKQTSVSHSSTESEIISLAAGLRMDGLLALDLWDVGLFRWMLDCGWMDYLLSIFGMW